MKLFIMSGTNRGLGYSMANRALENGDTVLTVARKNSFTHPEHHFIEHDLTTADGLEEKFSTALQTLSSKSFSDIILINNAAVVTPIGKIDQFNWNQISNHMNINFLLPMFLTSLFLKLPLKGNKIVANISSGAALRPIDGWSLYCSSKAGLKMFTDCLVNEFPSVKMISINPGVMDTEMQSTIREQDSKNFSRVEDFRQLKEQNQLKSTDSVADEIITLLNATEAINKTWYDIKGI